MRPRITRTPAAPVEPAGSTAQADAQTEPRQPAQKPRKREKRDSITVTFDIPHDLNFKITGIAQAQRMRKTAFILKLLKQGCGAFKMSESLDRVWAETQGQDVSATAT